MNGHGNELSLKEVDLAEADAKRRKVQVSYMRSKSPVAKLMYWDQRSCDVCRRKKIRHEGPMNTVVMGQIVCGVIGKRESVSVSLIPFLGPECANCQEFRLECTYVEVAKRRGPSKGCVKILEQRYGRLEKILHQVRCENRAKLPTVSVGCSASSRRRFDFDNWSANRSR